MDYYQLLGVQKNASKEEIKLAFRRLAMQFHPDKHFQSCDHSKDSANFKFKQISEAYETLIDDRKRADYNIGKNAYRSQNKGYSNYNSGGGSGYAHGNSQGYGYSGSASRSSGNSGFARFEMGLRFLTSRSFLLNATFAGNLLKKLWSLWKKQNQSRITRIRLQSGVFFRYQNFEAPPILMTTFNVQCATWVRI